MFIYYNYCNINLINNNNSDRVCPPPEWIYNNRIFLQKNTCGLQTPIHSFITPTTPFVLIDRISPRERPFNKTW